MIEVKPVSGKKMQKAFVEYPLELYKGNENFVPPLFGDEMKIFSSDYVYAKTCESQCFLAYRDGRVCGRIQGIIQKQYNELHSEKRVRFSRIDGPDDFEVFKALFAAVEAWAVEKGMDTVCGPLGYSDLEREGLLIDGFQWLSTFEEQYNHPYYQTYIEKLGYKKEVDWVEYRLSKPETRNPMIDRVAQRALELCHLHMGDLTLSKKQYIERYKDGIFSCIDECYAKLYGTVPFTKEMEKSIIDQFMLIVDKRFLIVVLDEQEKVVAFGLCFPAIGKAVQKSGGRLTPGTLLRILSAVGKPEAIDLGLVAVLPEYQARGVNAVMLKGMLDMLDETTVQYCETNLNLEDNLAVQSQWKYFTSIQHKKRRSYIKTI